MREHIVLLVHAELLTTCRPLVGGQTMAGQRGKSVSLRGGRGGGNSPKEFLVEI